jgi:MFS transporter, ACS family, glucarate transporter
VLRSKEIIAVTVSYFCYGYVAWIFFSWFYIYLVQVRGLNLKVSAAYSMIPFVAMTTGCLLGGVASDWLVRLYGVRLGRCWLSMLALVCTGVLLVLGSHVVHARTASLVLACGAGALYVSQSCFWSLTADVAAEHAGVVSGLMNMGGQVGAAVTASVTPLIAAHFGWNASFLAGAVLVALGGLAWIAVDPNARLTPQH